jgi:hypothetical protein
MLRLNEWAWLWLHFTARKDKTWVKVFAFCWRQGVNVGRQKSFITFVQAGLTRPSEVVINHFKWTSATLL